MNKKLFVVLIAYIMCLFYSSSVYAAYSGATQKTNAITIPSNFQYTIEFNKNASDASGTMDSITNRGSNDVSNATLNTKKTLPANQFIRTGYIFAGWMLNPNDTTVFLSDKAMYNSITFSSTMKLNTTIVLYAKWEPITYTVKFLSGTLSESVLPEVTQTCKYGTTYYLRNNTFDYPNHQFDKWVNVADSSKTYTNMQSIKNLTTVDHAVITLRATWIIYTGNAVNYDADASTHNCANYLSLGYNDNGHYKECSICGKHYSATNSSVELTLGYETHDMNGHWTGGSASNCNETNVYINTCSICAYSTTSTEGRAQHDFDNSTWAYNGVSHFHACKGCKAIKDVADHTYNGSTITCATGGECDICHFTISAQHVAYTTFTYSGGKSSYTRCACSSCNSYDVFTPKVSGTNYASRLGVTYADASDGIAFTATLVLYIPAKQNSTVTSYIADSSRNYPVFLTASDGTITDKSITYKTSTTDVGSRLIKVVVSGTKTIESFGSGIDLGQFVYTNTSGVKCVIRPTIRFDSEITPPSLSTHSISPLKQGVVNGVTWATQNTMTFRGTENFCKSVKCILSKDGEEIASGEVSVSDAGKWVWECSPVLEIKDLSETLQLQCIDSIGNKSETYDISLALLTDSKAPMYAGTKEIVEGSPTAISTAWTNKSRTYRVTFTDNGVGGCEIALNTTSEYSNATQNGNKYYKDFVFDDDIYGTQTIVFHCKDALDNSITVSAKVYNIDLTKPTIEKVQLNNNQVTMIANDNKTFINANGTEEVKAGSGVVAYGYKGTGDSTIQWNTTKIFTLSPGYYELYAKDKAGNISAPLTVGIGEASDVLLSATSIAFLEDDLLETSPVIQPDEQTIYYFELGQERLDDFFVEKETDILDLVPKIEGKQFVAAFADNKEIDLLAPYSYHIKNGSWIEGKKVCILLYYVDIPPEPSSDKEETTETIRESLETTTEVSTEIESEPVKEPEE